MSESKTRKAIAISIAYSRKFVPWSAGVPGALAAATGERTAVAVTIVRLADGDATATV